MFVLFNKQTKRPVVNNQHPSGFGSAGCLLPSGSGLVNMKMHLSDGLRCVQDISSRSDSVTRVCNVFHQDPDMNIHLQEHGFVLLLFVRDSPQHMEFYSGVPAALSEPLPVTWIHEKLQ